MIAGPDTPPWTLPITGRRVATSIAMPEIVLITASPSLPASMHSRAFSRMSVWLGESLVMSGFFVSRAAGGDDARAHLRVVAELHAAFLHVRAGDVDLHRVDRRIVEAARDLGVLLDGRAADVGDEARLGEVERRQDLPHHVVDAGVLQADRVDHAVRRFRHAVRRVAEPRLPGRALQHDRADVAVREPGDARVFLAEADAAREQHDGRGELQAAEVDREGGRRARDVVSTA